MTRLRCAILDDYLKLALKVADWSRVGDRVDVTVFNQPFASPEAAAGALKDFEIICAMRERTPFPRTLFAALPKLKLLITSGMRNAAIDMDAARGADLLDELGSGTRFVAGNVLSEEDTASAIECLHYAMNLPTSVVITGCDSMPILQQALDAGVESGAGSEHQHRGPPLFGAPTPHHLEAVQPEVHLEEAQHGRVVIHHEHARSLGHGSRIRGRPRGRARGRGLLDSGPGPP